MPSIPIGWRLGVILLFFVIYIGSSGVFGMYSDYQEGENVVVVVGSRLVGIHQYVEFGEKIEESYITAQTSEGFEASNATGILILFTFLQLLPIIVWSSLIWYFIPKLEVQFMFLSFLIALGLYMMFAWIAVGNPAIGFPHVIAWTLFGHVPEPIINETLNATNETGGLSLV